jgi:hypothetical protein
LISAELLWVPKENWLSPGSTWTWLPGGGEDLRRLFDGLAVEAADRGRHGRRVFANDLLEGVEALGVGVDVVRFTQPSHSMMWSMAL